MIQQEFKLSFNAPAFLGNAQQSGQWRTPPFKAQLRQWWRVAYAAERDFKVNMETMRSVEGKLFGHAWLENDLNDEGKKTASRKSLVRIRLDNWGAGKLKQAPDIGQVTMGANKIQAVLYSGYGPINQGPKLKANAAIQANEHTFINIAFPEGALIEDALGLMHRYGTVGGRSRNGWGSYQLLPSDASFILPGTLPLQDWQQAFSLDWPHAIGADQGGKPLIWQTATTDNWEDVMRLLAQARVDMRRKVPDRLALAYPDTRKTMPGWGRNDRVPNSVRFKVRKEANVYVGVIFYMPCRPADALWNALQPNVQRAFPENFAVVHQFLDGHAQFKRAAY